MALSLRHDGDVVHVPAWSAWSLEVFGDPYLVFHDGADFSELRRRWALDPDAVERIIRIGLSSTDPLAARCAADLASIGGGAGLAAELELRLATSGGILRVEVARALSMLTSSLRWNRPICEILREHPDWQVRMDAALALADCATDAQAIAALENAATSDSEYLVRHHAERSLRTLKGQPDDPTAGWTPVD